MRIVDRAPLARQLVEHPLGRHALEAARLRLGHRQVAERAQHVVQRVGVRRLHALGQVLEVGLDLGERVGVDQLAQLLLAEQLAQQVAVERQRRRAPLGVGRVALVHVGRDVVEQQRRRERGRALGLDLDQRQLAAVQVASAGRSGRAGRARRAGTRGRSRARSGTGRSAWPPRAATAPSAAAATAACACPGRRAAAAARGRRSRGSARRTARSAPSSRTTRSSSSSGLDHHELGAGRLVGVGQVHDDAVVGPDRVGLEPELVADAAPTAPAPQAACTRPPNGVSTHSRQSPISSRKRSITIVRSLGTTRVASRCSRRYATRLLAARSSRS